MEDIWMKHFACEVLTEAGLKSLNAATGMEIGVAGSPSGGLFEAADMAGRRCVLIAFDDGETRDATLGRMMAHAAEFEAEAFVWICSEASPAHAAACEWLNGHSAGMEFYLLEVRFRDMKPVFEARVRP